MWASHGSRDTVNWLHCNHSQNREREQRPINEYMPRFQTTFLADRVTQGFAGLKLEGKRGGSIV